MELSVMSIGAFTFPYNPTTTKFKADMKIGKHQYPLVNGCDIEVLGAEPIEVTCEGVFFKGMYSEDDTDPKTYFDALYNVFKQGKVVAFSHPIFPDCTKCVITSLEANVQPEDDAIHFTVTVTIDGTQSLYSSTATVVTPASSSSTTTKTTATVSYGTYKTTKKNQSLSSIITEIKKKLNTTAKKNKITKANLNTWNPKLKGKWGKLAKSTAVKYQK